jgi:hypothetical protein
VKVDVDQLAQLEEQRAFLLRSLADLEREHEAGDIDEHDYAALKDDYTARAASVLRALDEGRAALPPRRRAVSGRRRALTIGAVVVGAVVAGLAVARAAGQRLPGQTVTGNSAASVNAKLVQARQLLGTDRAKSLSLYGEVLAVQPDSSEAVTYHAWLQRLDTRAKVDAGSLTAATAAPTYQQIGADLSRAIKLAPTYADPRCLLAVLRFRDLNDATGARRSLDDCMDASPSTVLMQQVQAIDPEIDKALETSDPLTLKLSQARHQNDLKTILDQYDAILKQWPDSYEAAAWRAWTTALAANSALKQSAIDKTAADAAVTKAEAALDGVIAKQPANADAACFKAIIRYDYFNDLAGAKAPTTACLAAEPGPYVRRQLADIPTQLGLG